MRYPCRRIWRVYSRSCARGADCGRSERFEICVDEIKLRIREMSERFKSILIMSDIDGTFLGKHSRQVERNAVAVERFKAQGGLFTFNTGRTAGNLFSAVPEADRLANVPVALANGCCLYDAERREPVLEYLIEPENGLAAARYIAERLGDIGMRISTREGFLADPGDAVAVRNLERIKACGVRCLPIDEWDGAGWYKIVMIGSEGRLEKVRDELRGVFGGIFDYDKSGRNIIELHRPERSKASVIDTYREMYREERGELVVYAVGDYENDHEMLAAADVAVCPGNALDSVRDMCDLVLCSNDDGVIADLVDLLERTL